MFVLDTFQIYLVVVNVITFAAFTVDYLVCMKTGREELFSHVFLNVFAVAGGAAGMLLSFLVWDRKVNKRNVAWRLIAVCMLVLWIVIVLNVYDIVRLDVDVLFASFRRSHTALFVYLFCINLVTFIVFVADKRKAEKGKWRIPEGTLLGLSSIGGAFGGMLAMFTVRHKINAWYFKSGLPVLLALDAIVIAYLLQLGVA